MKICELLDINEEDTYGQPERCLIDLTHYKQKHCWDCGISCVLMVIPRDQRENFEKNFASICFEEGFNKSTWTIDLCYLLKRFGVHHVFYTVTMGVHPGYRCQTFYSNILTKDETRIIRRFEDAEQNGVTVYNMAVTCAYILDHLTTGPVIILTNARLLTCDICKFNKVSTELRKCIPLPTPYQGHYIVLCGYDIASQKVYYRNPTLSNRVCEMSLEDLENARKSYGTDQDVIFIFS